MKRPYSWILPVLVIAALCVPAVALPDVGDPLVLTVTPDVPVVGGDTIDLSLTEGNFGDLAVLFMGDELGTYPIGEIELDLIPTGMMFLGVFPMTGQIDLSFTLPDELPPEVSGMILYLQAVSGGMEMGPNGPVITYHKSNLDQIEFE